MARVIVRKDGSKVRPKKEGASIGLRMSEEQKRISKQLSLMTQAQRQQLAQLLVPRTVEEFMPHVPHPPQQVFMGLSVREALFGGAAGGGKSDALLMAALQYVDVPGYSALILRRTFSDLVLPGAIMDRASSWWRNTRARPIDGGRMWRFPSGARITFGFLQRSNDKYRYASSEHQFIAFDELTQFPEDDYTFLFSRLRKPRLTCLICNNKIRRGVGGAWFHISASKTCDRPVPNQSALDEYRPAKDGTRIFDIPLRLRSASNPGGIGNDWVRDRFITPETMYPGSIFVPARLTDNPSLDQKDYEESLSHLSLMDRMRLLAGDWNVTEEGGMFQRHWWGHAAPNEVPPDASLVRFWDLAASTDGDYTVGVKMAEKDGIYYVVDVFREQLTPFDVEKSVRRVAIQDGKEVRIWMEQEPGSSGKALIDHYRRNVLAGFFMKPSRPSANKVVRATPFSSHVEGGYVKLVLAQWNSKFMDECALFPHSDHDDMVDAAGGAYESLTSNRRSRIVV